MMQVPLDAAYREACTALGEAVVRERLLAGQAAQLTQERDALAARLAEVEKGQSPSAT